jgi:RNA polymerase sigma factor (sigma-70 family)
MSISTATAPPAIGRAAQERSPDWLADHVRRAATGEREAWSEIVSEFDGMLKAVARRHRLRDADAADVTQTTWLRLAENLGRLQDPGRVGAWLVTTARRECLRTIRVSSRELPDAEPPEPVRAEPRPIEGNLLAAERDEALWSAFGRLPARDQALLQMLVADPQPSYEEIAAMLRMPIGSIGPTRGRALARLRAQLERIEAPVDMAA